MAEDAEAAAAALRQRALAERGKAADPAYAYAPRWIPTGNWRMSLGDWIVTLIGVGIVLMVLGMRLFGVIG
ncbi:hypothetical protein JMJ55_06905 [Belnapia sp. T6]|uniref:Uncharacterized protein n=1 Tax=Belnapia mucosa TaxID=2804532 RepID=A0ABS1V1B2_9PROT|nr:hypothetical protein [Belnapia mucosa]MBL6455047.1 hypothetical protein [Belnapia mucosa]